MMIKLMVIATFFYASFALAENNCASFFEAQDKVADTIKNLAELKINLDIAKAKGLSSIELTALANNFKNKSTEFYKYVRENNLMTKDQYVNRLRQTIAKLQNEKENDSGKRREETEIRETHRKELKNRMIDGTRLVMHRIEPGPFKMREGNEDVIKIISQPFEMAATPTTQIVWRKVVELAHAKLADEYDALLDADPSNFKGDTNPVEEVSYDTVQRWIRALNELSKMGEASLAEIITGHSAGDVYRLPTSAEWEFVMRARGKYNDKYNFEETKDQIEGLAWYYDNSRRSTHPVAKLDPLMIDKMEFYDMRGNVWEWTSDILYLPSNRAFYIQRGASWSSDITHLLSGFYDYSAPEIGNDTVGFRLVKDLGTKP